MAYFKSPVGKIPYVAKRDRVASRAQQQAPAAPPPMRTEPPVEGEKIMFNVSYSTFYAVLVIIGLIIAALLAYKICTRKKQ